MFGTFCKTSWFSKGLSLKALFLETRSFDGACVQHALQTITETQERVLVSN